MPDHIVVDVAPMLPLVPLGHHYFLAFIHQPAIDKWLASVGTREFYLLSSRVVQMLLNEAFSRPLSVFAFRDGQLHPLAVVAGRPPRA